MQPAVVPVGFDFDDDDYFYVGVMNILKSSKNKNILKYKKVAIVIDDMKSADPCNPRHIKVYETADMLTNQGGYMKGTGDPNPNYIRVKPSENRVGGIEGLVFGR